MKTGYTYTVLRYVHDISTGEFVNVGVALYAPDACYASAICRHTHGRLSSVFPGMDGDGFKRLMRFVQSRMEEMGDSVRDELPLDGKPKSVMDIAHSVLPPDDSSLQWSPPGSGLTDDPSNTLEQLYERLVGRYDKRPDRDRRTDEDVWRKYKRSLDSRHVLKHFQPQTISGSVEEVEFRHAWKNGVWHCLEPVSFDLSARESIREKAHRWVGQLWSVRDAKEDFKVYLLLGEPQQTDLKPAFDRAVRLLEEIPVANEIIREGEAASFSERFAREIEAHVKPSV